MAASNLSNYGSALLLSLLAVAASAATPPPPAESSFVWSADVLSSDFRTDTLDLKGNVRVTQGPMSIEAQTAKALDFRSASSQWTFQRAVRIRTVDADLQSDSASAKIVDGQISSARVEGSPARFEQRAANADRQVRGRAGIIEYDFDAGIVQLRDQVWFSNGKDEFRGDVVIYNVRDERVQINPAGRSSGRVRGIIRPRQNSSETRGKGQNRGADVASPPSDARSAADIESGA